MQWRFIFHLYVSDQIEFINQEFLLFLRWWLHDLVWPGWNSIPFFPSTLIIYKVNIFKVNIFMFTYYLVSIKKYDKLIKRIHLFWWRIPKVFINYVWTVFLKKQRVMRHLFFVLTYVKWKTCTSSYFSLLATVVHSSSVCLYETNFPYERGHSIAHLIF